MSPTDIENCTCTQLPQEWGKKGASTAQEELYEPVPVQQFCHLPKQNKRWRVWDENIPNDILAEVKAIIYKGIV